MRKIILAALCTIVLAGGIVACGPAPSSLPDLAGHYECQTFDNKTYVAFDISELDFNGSNVTFGMDRTYTGKYWKDGDTYKFEITGGASAVSEAVAEEKNNTYEITAKPSGEGDDIIVYLKAKSGYVYMGAESATFRKTS